ncbi:hypothetical protein C2W62_29220 [Candidatus Entotheonella serta]|nr:hypothetical protein C2W62_29220 [Candidatus Entotheonella serta]
MSNTDREPIDLAHIAHEALQFFRASLPATIHIHERIINTGTVVRADSTQMYQLLLNLCSNAEHAMRGRAGQLEIRVEPAVIHPSPDSVSTPLPPGDYVRLTVSDTGYGIPHDIQKRIFDPFFTTKVVGEGAGMGLAIVHGIVMSHGGAITVESEVGQGTTFHVYLPRCWASIPERMDVEDAIPAGHGCILLVEDESEIASALQIALSNQGYEVVVHTKPVQAVEAFDLEPQRFDLVITDQTMPGMTGEQLAQAIRKHRYDIPIILCTAVNHMGEAEPPLPPAIDTICTKPLLVRELFNTIQQVLSP